MNANRVEWNAKHKALRQAMKAPIRLEGAKQLFLELHAPLHARVVSNDPGWNLEEELWLGLSEDVFRCVPPGEEQSIAWCLWHLARIEDVTMNLLLGDCAQVIQQGDWARRLHSPIQDTGNQITAGGIKTLSDQIAFEDLRNYRSAVGQRSREIIFQLGSVDIKRKTPPQRLQRCLDEGAVLPNVQGLLDYWGGLTVAGLLLMPPTRHNLSHLTETLNLKRKAQKVLKK
jgi:hypothetical protein